MRVLICGEGPGDIGRSDVWDETRRDYRDHDGWMQPLIRGACNGAAIMFSVRKRNDLLLLGSQRQAFRPLPAGHGAKAMIAKLQAVREGYDAVVFMADADSNRRTAWAARVAEIEAGFARIPGEMICIACVPMAASESWLMSDAAAWRVVANYDGEGLPARPETIWGQRDDGHGNHPHRLFARICRSAAVADNPDTRARIAEALSLPTSRTACPISLEPFLRALEMM